MSRLDATHDPALVSWVASANQAGTDFPIQNLPFGVFRARGSNDAHRIGVAIGEHVLDLARVARSEAAHVVAALGDPDATTLNAFMGAGRSAWTALRHALSAALRDGAVERAALEPCLVPQDTVEMGLPARIGDYTDFYSSVHHATAVGKLFRPDAPLTPNYKWVPIGYHGRASTIGVSGQRFHRPMGQTMPAGASTPVFGPSKRLDYELEVGIFIGPGNDDAAPIPIARAEDHVFGLTLLNDWSARDIQAWEYVPLGPFLAKNFASTISPWVVTLEALAPFRTAWTRPADDPQPLPYLEHPSLRDDGAFDIVLEASLSTARSDRAGAPPMRLSKTSFRHAYWSIAQMVAHHTVGGCRLVPGDFLGSGTESGPTPEEGGSLLELSNGGKTPLALPGGESRTFLEDGDTVVFRAWCEKEGARRIGFGTCAGTVLPAR